MEPGDATYSTGILQEDLSSSDDEEEEPKRAEMGSRYIDYIPVISGSSKKRKKHGDRANKKKMKKMGKRLQKKSDKKTKRLAKYVWKNEKARVNQDYHQDMLDLQCICSKCTEARRPRPRKLFSFNLFSCDKGGLRFGPADEGGGDYRDLKRYLKRGDQSILLDRNICTRKMWQLWPFYSKSRYRGYGSSYSSSTTTTTTSDSSSSRSSSSGSFSSSTSSSSEDSSDRDHVGPDVKEIDGLLVRRRSRRQRRTGPRPPPLAVQRPGTSKNQATRARPGTAPSPAANLNPRMTSGGTRSAIPDPTRPAPNVQPKKARKNVRFLSQNLPSPPMKKAPRKSARPERGILRAPKKVRPGRAAAVQPPPSPRVS